MAFRFSCPHTSSQNGKAERKIRSINNVIRTLLAHAQLPNTFWHHALEMATYILNILPSKNLNYNTPTQLLYNRIPSYDHLRVFGCLCYPILPATTIHKLQNRSQPCVFIGFPSDHRGYKCLDLNSNKIIISRHVVFDETIFPFAQTKTPTPSYELFTENIHPHFWAHLETDPTHTKNNNQSQLTPTHFSAQQQPSTHHSPIQHTPSAQTPSPTPSSAHHPSSAQQQTPTPPSAQQHSPNPSISPTSTTPPTSTHTPLAPTQPPPPVRTIITRAMDGITKPKRLFTLHTSTIVPIPKNPTVALSIPEWHNAMTRV